MVLFIIFVVLFIFSFLELSKRKYPSKKTFQILYFIISSIVVCRYGVGADYEAYEQGYNWLSSLKIDHCGKLLYLNAHEEFGYLFLAYLLGQLGTSYFVLAFIIGSVTMILYYRFFKIFCHYSVFSLFVFYSIYFIIYPFNVIRQGLTIALFLGILLPYLLQKKYLCYIIWTFVGMLFHYSLIIVLLLPILYEMKLSRNFIIFSILMGLLVPLEFIFNYINIFAYIHVISFYSDDSANVFALLHRIIFVIPALFLYFYSRNELDRKMALISLLGFIIFINFKSYSLIASRISVYFKVVDLFLFFIFFVRIKFAINRIVLFQILSILLLILFIKSMSVDINYLQRYNNLPRNTSMFEYPIINDYYIHNK